MKAWGISRAEFYSEREYEGGEIEGSEEIEESEKDGIEDKDLEIRLPSEIIEMISRHKEKTDLEAAVKKEIMRWYWMGYYEKKWENE